MEAYQKRFSSPMSSHSRPGAYSATMVLRDALERAGNADRAKLREARRDQPRRPHPAPGADPVRQDRRERQRCSPPCSRTRAARPSSCVGPAHFAEAGPSSRSPLVALTAVPSPAAGSRIPGGAGGAPDPDDPLLWQATISGVLIGGVYALVALGLHPRLRRAPHHQLRARHADDARHVRDVLPLEPRGHRSVRVGRDRGARCSSWPASSSSGSSSRRTGARRSRTEAPPDARAGAVPRETRPSPRSGRTRGASSSATGCRRILLGGAVVRACRRLVAFLASHRPRRPPLALPPLHRHRQGDPGRGGEREAPS